MAVDGPRGARPRPGLGARTDGGGRCRQSTGVLLRTSAILSARAPTREGPPSEAAAAMLARQQMWYRSVECVSIQVAGRTVATVRLAVRSGLECCTSALLVRGCCIGLGPIRQRA